jgi:Mrp family chromosome partitioning ATPase
LEYGQSAGLAELIAGKGVAKNSCQPTATKGLSFLPAGQLQAVADLGAAEALEKALGQWKSEFDCVLIDTGDWSGDTCSALARQSDATYLVVELGAVETSAAQAALARLRAAGARVLGCIAT